MFARIAGVGSYLPGQPVSNVDLIARGIDTSDEWIVSRTGIKSRHLADVGVTSSSLAYEACCRALAAADASADEIDLIIVATSTPDFIFPSTACLLQEKLGNVGAMAFDIQAVCSGFVYALTVAEKFIRSGSHKKALIVGAEVFSRILDWEDRATCVLFGDGAGAVVLEASEKPGILATAAHADGSHHGILSVPGGVCGGKVTGDPFLRMDGQAVFKFAVRVLADVAKECCTAAGFRRRKSTGWFLTRPTSGSSSRHRKSSVCRPTRSLSRSISMAIPRQPPFHLRWMQRYATGASGAVRRSCSKALVAASPGVLYYSSSK
jgi:3-oxoacyl-[acyl-carrier-protein] synthase-3